MADDGNVSDVVESSLCETRQFELIERPCDSTLKSFESFLYTPRCNNAKCRYLNCLLKICMNNGKLVWRCRFCRHSSPYRPLENEFETYKLMGFSIGSVAENEELYQFYFGAVNFDELYKQAGPQNTTAYVGGIKANTTEKDIRKVFSKYGGVIEVRVFKQQGYAFIRFDTKESLSKAIQGGIQMSSGNVFNLSYVKWKRQFVGELPAAVKLFDVILDGPLAEFIRLTKEIGGDVKQFADLTIDNVILARQFAWAEAARSSCGLQPPDQCLGLSRTALNRLIKDTLGNMRVALETRDLLQDCCVQFIKTVGTEANRVCAEEEKKMISQEHIFKALGNLGWEKLEKKVENQQTEQTDIEADIQQLRQKKSDSSGTSTLRYIPSTLFDQERFYSVRSQSTVIEEQFEIGYLWNDMPDETPWDEYSRKTVYENQLVVYKDMQDFFFYHAREYVSSLKKDIERFRVAYDTAVKELRQLTDKEKDLANRLHLDAPKASEMRSKMTAAKNQGKLVAGLMEAVRRKQLKGIRGGLGDLGTIPVKYDVAISSTCESLDCIVTDTTDEATKALQFVRNHELGQQQHLIPKMKSQKLYPENVPRMFDLVQCEDDIAPAFYYGLKETLVADNLDQATRIGLGGRDRHRVVTLSGEVVDSSSTMTCNVEGGRMGQARVGGVTLQQVEAAEEHVSKMQQELDQIRLRIRNVEESRDMARRELEQVETALTKVRTEIKLSQALSVVVVVVRLTRRQRRRPVTVDDGFVDIVFTAIVCIIDCFFCYNVLILI